MKLRPDTLALTMLLALLTAMAPLSTDMYLPSLPAMAQAFGTTQAQAQLTLSMFLLGMSIGVLIYGPLSDRYGRKPVLIAALTIFVLASIACMLAPDMPVLAAMRFLQAVGASGPVILARSIVRDLYSGTRAAQELARMASIMGIVPAVAPITGGVLHEMFGWQASFVAIALVGLAAMTIVGLSLPETAIYRQKAPLTPRELLRIFRIISANSDFRRYTFFTCATFGGIFTFISASSFILQGLAGMNEIEYGISFTSAVFGFVSGTIIGRRLVSRLGIDRTIGFGVLALAAGGTLSLLATEMSGISGWTILPTNMLVFMSAGIAMPQAIAGAMAPFPERAGSASSLLAFFQNSSAALLGIFVGHGLGDSARPYAVTVALLGTVSLVYYLLTRKPSQPDMD